MPHRPLLIYVHHEDPVVTQTLLEFLTDLGHVAAAFHSLDELRPKLEPTSPKPDVVIINLATRAPEVIELLRQAHQQHPEGAVLLITNGGGSLSAAEARLCGTRAFLREPLRLSELEFYLTRL